MMNFELLSLSWAKAAALKTDALVVLVADDQRHEAGLLSSMLDQAKKTGDFINHFLIDQGRVHIKNTKLLVSQMNGLRLK